MKRMHTNQQIEEIAGQESAELITHLKDAPSFASDASYVAPSGSLEDETLHVAPIPRVEDYITFNADMSEATSTVGKCRQLINRAMLCGCRLGESTNEILFLTFLDYGEGYFSVAFNSIAFQEATISGGSQLYIEYASDTLTITYDQK